MKVKKLLKGLLAAALAVTMAVTPAASVKAAEEVTVVSGTSTYVFTQKPVAAFEVTGFNQWRPFILYVLPAGTNIHSPAGPNSMKREYWSGWASLEIKFQQGGNVLDGIGLGGVMRGALGNGETVWLGMVGIYHSDRQKDYHILLEDDEIVVTSTDYGYDITAIPEAFAAVGATAVEISVEDALAKDNATLQIIASQADTQAAADAAAQADADAQAAADAAAQAAINNKRN